MTYTELNTCLACGGTDLWRYLDLGLQPLANGYSDVPSAKREHYPLGLQLCRACYHSQNFVAVDPDLMFKDYPYVSGTSESLREYFKRFVFQVEATMGYVEKDGHAVMPGLRVLEIASNDGTLLKEFIDHGHYVWGVDPAANLAPADLPTVITDYWRQSVVDILNGIGKHFDVIVAMNVLGHVADPRTFLKLCKQVLAPGGRIYIQTSQALMVKNGEFDTCYHEHLSFFTAASFLRLAERVDLRVDRITHVPVHGTSYLFELVPGARYEPLDHYDVAVAEIGYGYYQERFYETFRERAGNTMFQVRWTIDKWRSTGGSVCGYGAAAKGMTFLNFADIDISIILDDNPLKQGKIAPCGAVIWPPEDLKGAIDDKVLFVILAWNMKAEIIAKIKAIRSNPKDMFLTYYPVVTVEP